MDFAHDTQGTGFARLVFHILEEVARLFGGHHGIVILFLHAPDASEGCQR